MEIKQALTIIKLLTEAQAMIERGEYGAAVWINSAKKAILTEVYFGEWQTIDGLNQHPSGYNLDQWLEANAALMDASFSDQAPRDDQETNLSL